MTKVPALESRQMWLNELADWEGKPIPYPHPDFKPRYQIEEDEPTPSEPQSHAEIHAEMLERRGLT